MSEPITEADLQAYADGVLPAERRAAVAEWLAAHPEDAERIEAYRHLAQELRGTYQGVLDEPVPDRLMRSVGAARARRAAVMAAWIAIGVALGALAGWQLHELRPGALPAAESAAANRSGCRMSMRGPFARPAQNQAAAATRPIRKRSLP